MKTALEWHNEWLNGSGTVLGLIAAIQSDARLSTIEECAEMCDFHAEALYKIGSYPRQESVVDVGRDIRSLATPAKPEDK